MQAKAVVVGLGHVGTQLVGLLNTSDWAVVAYDKKSASPYPEEDVRDADLVAVCVNAQNKDCGGQDLTDIKLALERIPRGKLVVLRSTLLPGTADRLRSDYGHQLISWPEFFGETPYANHYWPDSTGQVPFQIVGGEPADRRLFNDALSETFGPEPVIHYCSNVEAEIIKYMENAFLALKVGFVNEFYSLAEALSADWYSVREGWLLDPRINRSHTAVFPHSRGFGGRCLPKDVSAIERFAHSQGSSLRLMSALLESNKEVRGEG